MNENSSGKRFPWPKLFAQLAESAGFRPVRWPLRSGSFGISREVSPYVDVSFRHVTNVDVAPDIYLGVYAEEFEHEWGERLKRTPLPPRFDEPPPFLLYAFNVASLMPRPWVPRSPSDQHIGEMLHYLERVLDYARQFPSNIDSLVAAIQANRIAEHTVEAYLCHPVKVRGFVQWLIRTHGIDVSEYVLPHLTDMTDPYDVPVMLGED
jgi:hypothetical protein